MARKIFGLVGPGDGPRLCVGEATRLLAEIVGMKTGKVYAMITMPGGKEVEVRAFDESGSFELPVGEWVQFQYDGRCMAICSLRIE
jgi:hypothetical protein